MAATSTSTEMMCPVCYEAFQDGPKTPLSLSCGHTFCRGCLAATVAAAPATKKTVVCCPTCRSPTALARPGDVSSIPKNFIVAELLAAAVTCDECGSAHATVFCAECHHQFCAKCDGVVHRLKTTSGHKRVPVSERATVEEPRCPLHHKKLHFFCRACNELCCMLCKESKHKGHNTVLCDDAVADILRDLKQDVAKLHASGSQRKAAEIRAAIEELRTSHQRAGERLGRIFVVIRATVDARERELRSQIKGELDAALTTLGGQLATATAAVKAEQEALAIGSRVTAEQHPRSSAGLFNTALDAQRRVQEAVSVIERCAAIAVEKKRIVWNAKPWDVCTSLAGKLSLLSFRDGPNFTVSGPQHSIATKTGLTGYSAVVGSRPFPKGFTTRWTVRVLRRVSSAENTSGVLFGVAPPTIKPTDDWKSGWFFFLGNSTLCSGPPQNFDDKKQCGDLTGSVADGSIVVVEVDTTRGTLSFIVNGKNGGVAFEGLPENLVPVVLLYRKDDSAESVSFETVF